MTLRRKMVYEIAATIVALLLISAAALSGLNALRQDFDLAIRGYQELRELYEMSSHIATARALLTLPRPNVAGSLEELQRAEDLADLVPSLSSDASWRTMRDSLAQARQQLQAASGEPVGASPSLGAVLSPVLAHTATIASSIRSAIEEAQRSADAKRHATMLVMAGLSAAVIVSAIVIGAWQYRSVINPLNRLSSAARSIAAGHFTDRIEPQGHGEFAALAEDFNRMAGELDGLYRQLEKKVAEKSKELVRSERLASVGYLAAGVAHEVNNPIGIIAGHAELMLSQLRRTHGGGATAEIEQTLRLICDEAFRCKQIVSRLLSLARPGDENRRRVDLADIASNVIATIGGLGEYRKRSLVLRADRTQSLEVVASEGEMKQVVLNLAINALEATPPPEGEVRIEVLRREELVELAVIDNGRGMSSAVLERVFEPFFTAKRGSTHPGTGLGLSICHAIVESHGGQIRAASDGPGKGSRFVVQLPAAPVSAEF